MKLCQTPNRATAPKDLLASGQWQNNIRGTKGAEIQLNEVLALFGLTEGEEQTVRQADGERSTGNIQKASWSQRNFKASNQAPRNRLALILGSQGNQVLLLFNKVNIRGGGEGRSDYLLLIMSNLPLLGEA